MADVRISLQITVDGRAVPGFEDVLIHRQICSEIVPLDVEIDGVAIGDLPAPTIANQQFLALRVDGKPLKVFTGSANDNDFTLPVGGGFVVWGVSIAEAEQFRIQNEDPDNAARLKGLVAGS